MSELSPIRTIVVATTNERKLAELSSELGSIPNIEFVSLATVAEQYGVTFTDPVETGSTFQENARIKAEGYLQQLQAYGIPFAGVLAEDSGFTATALTEWAQSQGLPEPMGVYTKDFYGELSGPDKTYYFLQEIAAAHEAGFTSTEGLFTTAMFLLLATTTDEEINSYEAIGELSVDVINQPVWNPIDPRTAFALDPVVIPRHQTNQPPITLSEYRQLSAEDQQATEIITHRVAAFTALRQIFLGKV